MVCYCVSICWRSATETILLRPVSVPGEEGVMGVEEGRLCICDMWVGSGVQQ